MKLDASERAGLIDLLSDLVGKHDDMRRLILLRGMAGFDQGEIEQIRAAGGNLRALELFKEIEFGEWEFDHVQQRLKNLERSAKLPERMYTLYEKFVPIDHKPPTLDPATAALLDEQREGKRTVALVGMASSTCNFAPFHNSEVEIWSCNEAHAWPWMRRATRWFQVHNSYKQLVSKRGVKGHYAWLKANPWGIPIYMQRVHEEIPQSAAYPLSDVKQAFLSNVHRGQDAVTFFNSSFDYMLAFALLARFERIEIYGFDMMGDNEYQAQLPSACFWLGIASQRAEVYIPPESMLLKSQLYGGKDQGEGWQ